MRITVVIAFISIFYACNSQKQISNKETAKEGNLNVVASYIQLEFAGDKNDENKSWLTLIMDKESFSEITIDSISFKPNSYQLSSEFQNFTMKTNQVRLLLQERESTNDKGSFKAIIYYQKEGNNYYQNLMTLQMKEPLYLP